MFHLKFDFGILFHYHYSIRAYLNVFVMIPIIHPLVHCVTPYNEPGTSS